MPVKPPIWRQWSLHIFFWMLLFGAWYYLRYQDYSTARKALVVTGIKVADLAAMVYICNGLLVPRLLYRKRILLFMLSFCTLVVASSLLKMYLIGTFLDIPGLLQFSGAWKTRIYDNVIPHFFLVTAGVAIRLITDHARLQQRLAEVAREKAEAELGFLKSQINPHFLFNSLNSVYFLIDRGNEAARDALHRFSEMLRYQLYECNGHTIPVEKELHYLRDYIALQQLRSSRLEVNWRCDDNVNGFPIEPLLLLPFVENCFKHLSHYETRENRISIDIRREDDALQVAIWNTTEGKGLPTAGGGGIGLDNVRRRLELLYPGRHLLDVRNGGDVFSVHLQISLNGHYDHQVHHH